MRGTGIIVALACLGVVTWLCEAAEVSRTGTLPHNSPVYGGECHESHPANMDGHSVTVAASPKIKSSHKSGYKLVLTY